MNVTMGASLAPTTETSAGSTGSPDAAACGDVFAALLASLAPPTAIPTCGVDACAKAVPTEAMPAAAPAAGGDVPTCAFGGPGTVPAPGRAPVAPPVVPATEPITADPTVAICTGQPETVPSTPTAGNEAPEPFGAPATTGGPRQPVHADDDATEDRTPVPVVPTAAGTVTAAGDDLPVATAATSRAPVATGGVTPPQDDLVTLAGPPATTTPASGHPTAAPVTTARDDASAAPPGDVAPDLAVIDVVATPTRTDPVGRELAPTSIGRLVAATVPQMRSSSDDVRLSVRLDPPSLGHVTVDISTRDGAVHVVVRPTDAASTDVLAAQRSSVSAALADAGFQLGGFDVRSNDRRDAPRPATARAALDAEDDDPPTIDDGALRL